MSSMDTHFDAINFLWSFTWTEKIISSTTSQLSTALKKLYLPLIVSSVIIVDVLTCRVNEWFLWSFLSNFQRTRRMTSGRWSHLDLSVELLNACRWTMIIAYIKKFSSSFILIIKWTVIDRFLRIMLLKHTKVKSFSN